MRAARRPALSAAALEPDADDGAAGAVQGELRRSGADRALVIEHVAIGAMQAEHVLERVGPGSLLIVPGDREDVIATIGAERPGPRAPPSPADAAGSC